MGNAASSEVGGALGGAVLGGLLLGPFGAIWGASVGSSWGGDARLRREQEDELQSMGLTQEIRDMAAQCVQDLQDAEQTETLCKNAAEAQKDARNRLQTSVDKAYAAAEAAMQAGDEDQARQHLVERRRLDADLAAADDELEHAEARLQRAQEAVQMLSERAAQVEALIKSTVANSAGPSVASSSTRLGRVDSATQADLQAMAGERWEDVVADVESADPLEQEFKRLEDEERKRNK